MNTPFADLNRTAEQCERGPLEIERAVDEPPSWRVIVAAYLLAAVLVPMFLMHLESL